MSAIMVIRFLAPWSRPSDLEVKYSPNNGTLQKYCRSGCKKREVQEEEKKVNFVTLLNNSIFAVVHIV
jgi:hypothetical protein